MWIPNSLVEYLKISKDATDAQRIELQEARAENKLLTSQLLVAQSNFDWLRMRVYQLELERAELIGRAYGIKTAVPEIIRKPDPFFETLNQFNFDDMGDEAAKKLGLPVYSDK